MNSEPLSLKQRFRLSRFFKGEAPSAGPIALNQRRVFILPTRSGLGFVLLIGLVLLTAFVYNNNLAYMLGFLLASMFFVTILHSFKALAGLVVRTGFNQAVFAGEKAGFNFSLQNPSDQYRIAVGIQLQEVREISLAPLQTLPVTLYVDTLRRGWLHCGTLTLSSDYPLGLFRAWSPLRFESKVLVYPRPARAGLAFPETDSGNGRQGQHKRSGDEFHGLKAYRSGDPIRQIHWKAYAKGRGLHSKQYTGATSAELWLDYGAAPGSGVEERLSALCRWVIDAEQAGLHYGLVLPGMKLAPGQGNAHYQACLQALSLF